MRMSHRVARVAKLADARDLKSRVSKETYRFKSGPGHHKPGCLMSSEVRRSVRHSGQGPKSRKLVPLVMVLPTRGTAESPNAAK